MGTAPTAKQIDTLMEQASAALASTSYFEAERFAGRALTTARQVADFDRMARIVMPLQEARRQRLQQALEVGEVTILDEVVDEEMTVEPGCYLIQPPLVGADARRLRLMAIEAAVPLAVVCREPRTQLGLCPIVAICPGVTIRTKIDPPADPAAPDLPWFVDALEALGDFAIDSLDPALPPLKRLDELLLRIEAVPDHEALHLALVDACRDAQREAAEEAASGKKPGRARTTTRS
jgi:hypothetical protein